jgi:hypothetical protein
MLGFYQAVYTAKGAPVLIALAIPILTQIIGAKVGLLELAKQLGNVSQACKLMGYSRDSFTVSRSCTTKAVRVAFNSRKRGRGR